ncbi:uncharacterized protein LOC117181355 [Belonocnema kinseyi]|uniref:uncharacterized protein LOC117181355 n=1 Tax=Belonocnema kinseyi TaxID=2817044 RepID=UPI00143D2659|nr:uncharacterized protein LOC117181355 [Belonocnema kinseyi]
MEEREVQVNTATIIPLLWEFLHQFSTLQKLLRTTAWLMKFLLYRFYLSDPMKTVVTPLELHYANLALIRHEQHHYFGAVINILISGKISPKKKLARLTPYIDAKYLLRVGGRLKNSIPNPDEKHPLFLAS